MVQAARLVPVVCGILAITSSMIGRALGESTEEQIMRSEADSTLAMDEAIFKNAQKFEQLSNEMEDYARAEINRPFTGLNKDQKKREKTILPGMSLMEEMNSAEKKAEEEVEEYESFKADFDPAEDVAGSSLVQTEGEDGIVGGVPDPSSVDFPESVAAKKREKEENHKDKITKAPATKEKERALEEKLGQSLAGAAADGDSGKTEKPVSHAKHQTSKAGRKNNTAQKVIDADGKVSHASTEDVPDAPSSEVETESDTSRKHHKKKGKHHKKTKEEDEDEEEDEQDAGYELAEEKTEKSEAESGTEQDTEGSTGSKTAEANDNGTKAAISKREKRRKGMIIIIVFGCLILVVSGIAAYVLSSAQVTEGQAPENKEVAEEGEQGEAAPAAEAK